MTLDDPFVMLSEEAIATGSGTGTNSGIDEDYEDIYDDVWITTHTFKDHNGRICTETWSGYSTDCLGTGSLPCEDEYVVTSVVTKCGGPSIL